MNKINIPTIVKITLLVLLLLQTLVLTYFVYHFRKAYFEETIRNKEMQQEVEFLREKPQETSEIADCENDDLQSLESIKDSSTKVKEITDGSNIEYVYDNICRFHLSNYISKNFEVGDVVENNSVRIYNIQYVDNLKFVLNKDEVVILVDLEDKTKKEIFAIPAGSKLRIYPFSLSVLTTNKDNKAVFFDVYQESKCSKEDSVDQWGNKVTINDCKPNLIGKWVYNLANSKLTKVSY